ncbi:MAG TPA: glycosyltransferase [Cytophagales bacterium]|nr:glycosyltransferase [Cytophagales bacterium]
MHTPLVTVICLCYNHAHYIEQALDSVLMLQDYPSIQLIVCNDASTDQSAAIIEKYRTGKEFLFIDNESNMGNCKTFNKALAYAKGKYIIDLPADDYLLPNTLALRIAHFEAQPEKVGITYSNARYVNEHDAYQFSFHDITQGKEYHEGYVFKKLFEGRFICPPSVIFRSSVLKSLGGYDEQLSFEDFDIWMRMSKVCDFKYIGIESVAKRIVTGSLSARFYKKGNPEHLQATLIICEKALTLAQPNEYESIGRFALYHFRLSFYTANYPIGQLFYNFARQIIKIDFKNRFLKLLLDKGINIYVLYRLYLNIRLKDTKLS